MSDLLLPPGTRLLHIGPHKTGTTALQVALSKARTELERQGVRYLWGGVRQTNANLAAQALAGKASRKFASETAVPYWHWENLLEKVRASTEARVVVSGEEFCNFEDDAIAKAVESFGNGRTKVFVTLRPLEKILASQWQQYVQFGAVTDRFEDWLKKILAPNNSDQLVRDFWIRHRHDRLVERWSKAVGAPNLICLVLNPKDHSLLFRSVQDMLGLREGTLQDEGRLINRSITAPEAEAIRALYERLQKLGYGDLSRHIRYMISPSELIKRDRVPVGEAKSELPRWALERARELSAEIAKGIGASGTRIIGNLDDLVPEESVEAPEHLPVLDSVPADLPGWTAAGVIISSGIARGDLPPTPTTTLPTAWLRRATGSQLMREVMRRVRIRLLQPFSRLRSEKKGDGL